MKNLKFLSVVLLLFSAFSFTSCTQDLEPVDPAIVFPNPTNPNPNNPNPVPGVFKVDIDGVNFGGVKALEARTRSLIEANGALTAEVSALRGELLESRREMQELLRRVERLEGAGSR